MDLLLPLIVDGICTGARYAILGMGFALIFNTQRMFDISFGGVYTWCGFALWILVRYAGLNIIVAGVVALGLAFSLSYLIQKVYMAKMRARSDSAVSIMLGSMAVLMALEAIATILWGGGIRNARSGDVDVFKLGSIQILDIKFYSLIFAVSIFLLFRYLFKRTPLGLNARAIATNSLLSRIVGMETEKILTLTTCLGCTIIALDAVLVCADTGVYPAIGFQSVLIAFMAMILGGIGSFEGAAVGGLMIGLVRTVAVYKFPTLWQEMILFAILFLIIAFRPIGLFGIKDWKSEV
ncbi:MAG: branched-chain amino acid ABC transporter permease [Thermodesulfobacteriota bacterium]|jgi:branched-chain amino acid transport system permease protein